MWKRLYHDVFEYSRPLSVTRNQFPKPDSFTFIDADSCSDSSVWKRSVKSLFDALHVIPPDHCSRSKSGRYSSKIGSRKYFNRLSDALFQASQNASAPNSEKPLILIHSGSLQCESISVNFPVSILGATEGCTESACQLLSLNEATFIFRQKSLSSFFGFLNVKCRSCK